MSEGIDRVAFLTEDAEVYKDSIQLHYKRRGLSSGFSGPSAEVCPPLEQLKKGTKVILTLSRPRCGNVLKVKLAKD